MKSNLYWMLGLVLLVWLVEIMNLSMGYQLNEWGILPRSSTGLLGIPVSPFLHGGTGHVLSNTLGFAVLGSLVMMRGRMLFLQLSLVEGSPGRLAVRPSTWEQATSSSDISAIYWHEDGMSAPCHPS